MPWATINLHVDDFAITTNSALYRILIGMDTERKAISFASILTEIRDSGKLGEFPAHMVSEITLAACVPAVLPQLGKQLREKRSLRILHAGLSETLKAISAHGATADESIESTLRVVEGASKTRIGTKPAPTMKELVTEVVTRIQRRTAGEKDEVGISTGIKALDRETGGLRLGATWVLAGPSKGGKSLLALNLLEAVSVNAGLHSLFFGLEMPAVENVERMFASVGGIRASVMRDGVLNSQDFTKAAAVAERLAKSPIIFRDDVFDLAELIAVAKQAKMANPELYAVFVDYAQLVGNERQKGENREQEVAAVSAALRRLAMQEKLCVVVLSQLNDDGKLRESRKLGMDATVIAMIEPDDEEGVRRLKLVQRAGRRCTLRMAFRPEFMRFDNLPEGQEYADDESPQTEKKGWSRK